MINNDEDRVEILSPSLLEKYPETVAEVDLLCKRLGREIGWHYILDLVWILETINLPVGSTILDAGAGNGVLQFALASRGYNVISVDFSARRIPPLAALAFSIKNMGGEKFDHEYISHLESNKVRTGSGKSWKDLFTRIFIKLRTIGLQGLVLPFFWFSRFIGLRKPGSISYYRSDMSNMDSVANGSVDTVVSVSAIEHMEHDVIAKAVKEFRRVLKPDGKIILTTSAAESDDWFHESSKGWCFSEHTIRKLFDMDEAVTSNWDRFEELMNEYHNSQELKRRIPLSYKLSDNNGMPRGIWNPTYLPVGVHY